MPDKLDKTVQLNKALKLPNKGLVKLKNEIDTTKYNVLVQDKKEGKTYLLDSSELNSGGGDSGLESIVAGDNITIDDTDPLNPIISTSSALLPNGIKIVTESRDLQADDAGYMLNLTTEDVDTPTVLNIPYPSPLSVNESFGLVISNADFLICGYSSIPDGLTLVTPALNENVLFTTTAIGGGGNYTFPVSTAVFEDKTALRYLYDNISLRGTAILSSGTVTVTTSSVKTDYKIYVSVNTSSGTQGFLSAPTGSIVDGTSFVINSTSVLDDSTVNWWIAP